MTLEKIINAIREKFKTPHTSILCTVLFMVATILFLDLEMLMKTASTLMILLYATVNFVVIIMRESGIENYQPRFRTPWYPCSRISHSTYYFTWKQKI